MLLSGWNMDEALIVSKEEGFEDGFEVGFAGGKAEGKAEGAAQERAQNIRALKDVLSPEKIAETFNVTKEYVLEVLDSDDTMIASEKELTYNDK
jgi:hypothetical protein